MSASYSYDGDGRRVKKVTGSTKQKFTGYERDDESNLDYAQARYYSTTQGRFISTDPLNGAANVPQSWNRYAYALNNPLLYTDPTGMRWAMHRLEDGNIQYRWFEPDELGKDSEYRFAISQSHGYWEAVKWDESKPHYYQVSARKNYPTLTEAYVLMPDGQFGYEADFEGRGPGVTTDMGTQLVIGSALTAGVKIFGSTVNSFFNGASISGEGRVFTHFTNAEGASGITGINATGMKAGQSTGISELQFGFGRNTFLASEPGRIFVTEHGINATQGTLNGIGVFGAKQQFAIQFSEGTAFSQGIRIVGEMPSRSIFTIPGGSTMTGGFKLTRRF